MEKLARYALEVSVGEASMLRGAAGKSAYEIAVQNGYTGTETEWLASLKGDAFTFSDFTDEQLAALKGADGTSPTVATSKTEKVTTITVTDKDGEHTATINDGADGKSAYAYAVEGGYTGTETEFAAKLASGALIVHVTDNNGNLSANKTYIEIRDAIFAGIPVFVDYDGSLVHFIQIYNNSLYFGTFQCDSGDATNPAVVTTLIIEITPNGEVNDVSAYVEIPKTLPNPNAITFTGAVTGSYDGSAPVSVEIPSAVTDAHINSLIDTKLGVIENGSY